MSESSIGVISTRRHAARPLFFLLVVESYKLCHLKTATQRYCCTAVHCKVPVQLGAEDNLRVRKGETNGYERTLKKPVLCSLIQCMQGGGCRADNWQRRSFEPHQHQTTTNLNKKICSIKNDQSENCGHSMSAVALFSRSTVPTVAAVSPPKIKTAVTVLV